MRIPFSNPLNDSQKKSLEKLGFMIHSKKIHGKIISLDFPENPRLRCKLSQRNTEICDYVISYNEVPVIQVSNKHAHWDSYAILQIDDIKIDSALALDCSFVPKLKRSPLVLTDNQKRLKQILCAFVGLVYGDSAYRGYAENIPQLLAEVKRLRDANPREHDTLIYSNNRFINIFELFENWSNNSRIITELNERATSLIANSLIDEMLQFENNSDSDDELIEGYSDIDDWSVEEINIPEHLVQKYDSQYSGDRFFEPGKNIESADLDHEKPKVANTSFQLKL